MKLQLYFKIMISFYFKNFRFFCRSFSRSDYLHRELISMTENYPNAKVADWREAPIWGGTSLLTTLMKGLKDLVQVLLRKLNILIFQNLKSFSRNSNFHL